MTEFLNGPAANVKLMLRYAPEFIRVVLNPAGEWDALDSVNDSPKDDEQIFAYFRDLSEPVVQMHLNTGRKPGGGFFQMAKYRMVTVQPPELTLRLATQWQQWCQRKSAIMQADASRQLNLFEHSPLPMQTR